MDVVAPRICRQRVTVIDKWHCDLLACSCHCGVALLGCGLASIIADLHNESFTSLTRAFLLLPRKCLLYIQWDNNSFGVGPF